MLPSVPPNVSKFGSYTIDETCRLLGCCRDKLRALTQEKKIKNDYLDDETETTVYKAREILRYWFNTTKQPHTEGQLNVILDSLQEKGYVATFGCEPPEMKVKNKRLKKSSEIDEQSRQPA